MKLLKYYFLVLSFFSLHFTYAQIPEIQWQQCYGSSGNNSVNGVCATQKGYLFAIHIGEKSGITNYHGAGDIWIVNTDSNGSINWELCFGGSSGDIPQKIEKINNDEYLIYGYTFSTDGDVQSNNYGEGDLWVIKINGEGDLLWEKCYGSPGPDEARDIIHTPDGGFVLLSRVHVSGGDVSQYYGSWDVWMCKCDSLGNIEWEKTLGNQWLDNGISMIINSEGNIMMIGAAAHYGGIVDCDVDDGYGDVWIVELDLSGEIIWQNCYGGSYYDLGYQIIETKDGYIIAASSTSNDGDVSGHHGTAGIPPDSWADTWIVKLNNMGEIIWENSFGGTEIESPIYITETENGNIVSIGITRSDDGDVSGNHSIPNHPDIWYINLSPNGEVLTQHCYGGFRDERLESHTILKKGDYNYVIAAATNYMDGNDDIQCEINTNMYDDAWIFEIKDCSQYPSEIPQMPMGVDTLCSNINHETVFTISSAEGATNYQWQLSPENAGTISGDSIVGLVNWSPDFEGTASIVARSANDCGESQWSQPHYTEVFTCLGTEELYADAIKLNVYPNPANNVVNFEMFGNKESAKQSHTITITNTYGQQIAKLEVKDNKTIWDTRSIKSGIYFYSIEIHKSSSSGKIVILK